MAKIGLKYPVAAEITAEPTGELPTYGEGFVIGKAISANKNITSNDNPLYGDDAIAENDTSFSEGTIELGVTDFGTSKADTLEIQAKLLGHTVVTEGTGETAVKVIRKKASDNAPTLGFGYYKTKKLNNVNMYEATWLYKIKFQLPSETNNTKGQNIEWQTATITARIMALPNMEGVYEDTAVFATEAECKAWLDAKANIT
jgi:hypothetical protein